MTNWPARIAILMLFVMMIITGLRLTMLERKVDKLCKILDLSNTVRGTLSPNDGEVWTFVPCEGSKWRKP